MTTDDELNPEFIAITTVREIFNRPSTPGTHLWAVQAELAQALLGITTNEGEDLIDLADQAQRIDRQALEGDEPVGDR